MLRKANDAVTESIEAYVVCNKHKYKKKLHTICYFNVDLNTDVYSMGQKVIKKLMKKTTNR